MCFITEKKKKDDSKEFIVRIKDKGQGSDNE